MQLAEKNMSTLSAFPCKVRELEPPFAHKSTTHIAASAYSFAHNEKTVQMVISDSWTSYPEWGNAKIIDSGQRSSATVGI